MSDWTESDWTESDSPMESSIHLARARQLIQQGRWELAEKDLRLALAERPDDSQALSLLALCLNQRKEYAEARRLAREAVLFDPENAFSHYVLGTTLYAQNHFPEAEQAIQEALRLNPYDAFYHAARSRIAFAQGRWKEALDAADAGLEVDPENDDCVNLRAVALVKLGQKHDAHAAIRSALQRDPENSDTHANLGWTLLEQGKPQDAMEHFREALRLDPESEWARRGIVEAMKARFIVYGWLLRFFLWTSRLSSQAQWGLMLGGLFGYRILNQIADRNPDLEPWIRPICILYIVFVVMTWIGTALFNLLLRLNRFGRLALSREETITSNWVGATLLLAVIFLAAYFVLGHEYALPGAVMFGLMSFPLSRIYACDEGWPRTTLIACTAGMAVLAIGSVASLLLGDYGLDGPAGDALMGLGVLAFYAFCLTAFVMQFVIQWLVSAVVRR